MGLRLTEGIDPRRFTELSGRKLDEQPDRRTGRTGHGGRAPATAALRVTQEGFPVLDMVVADLAA